MVKTILNNRFFSGSAVYLLSNILAAAIPFVLLPVLTRYLTPPEYGQVAMFQTVLAGLSAFIGISAQGSAGVKYYDDCLSQCEIKYFIGNCFLVLIVTAAIVFLIVFIFRQTLSYQLGLETKWILFSVVVSSAIFIVAMRMSQWQVRKQAKFYGALQVMQSLTNMIFSLILVVYFSQGAPGRIWVLSVVPIGFAIIALISLYRDNLLGFAWRPKFISEILSFGVPLIPHTFGFFLLSSVDRVVINDKLGLEQVGVYMVAVQLVSVMSLIFDAINNAYVPWLFDRLKRDKIEEKKQIVRWTYIYCVALLVVVFFAFLIGPYILILIVGTKYSEASTLVGWLALGYAFNGMYLMVTNYIFYSKRTGLLSLSTITAGLINVGLMIILVGFLGLKGVAIAFATSAAIKFLFTWYVAQKRHPMPWFNFGHATSQI